MGAEAGALRPPTPRLGGWALVVRGWGAGEAVFLPFFSWQPQLRVGGTEQILILSTFPLLLVNLGGMLAHKQSWGPRYCSVYGKLASARTAY